MQTESAWRQINSNFDGTKPRRLISGFVITSRDKNANGDAFEASGIRITLPAPLLYGHSWTHPIGRVTSVETSGPRVRFSAEICNRSGPFWLDQVWPAIVARELTCMSMGGIRSLAPTAFDGRFVVWAADEFSVVETGADLCARISRVWDARTHGLPGWPAQSDRALERMVSVQARTRRRAGSASSRVRARRQHPTCGRSTVIARKRFPESWKTRSSRTGRRRDALRESRRHSVHDNSRQDPRRRHPSSHTG